MDTEGPSLADTLTERGYTHRPSKEYDGAKDILDPDGAIVCTGNAGDVWEWLYEQEVSRMDAMYRHQLERSILEDLSSGRSRERVMRSLRRDSLWAELSDMAIRQAVIRVGDPIE